MTRSLKQRTEGLLNQDQVKLKIKALASKAVLREHAVTGELYAKVSYLKKYLKNDINGNSFYSYRFFIPTIQGDIIEITKDIVDLACYLAQDNKQYKTVIKDRELIVKYYNDFDTIAQDTLNEALQEVLNTGEKIPVQEGHQSRLHSFKTIQI